MSEQIPEALARYGFQGKIVVDECPYCGGTHYHRQAADGARQRLAECLRGEYILVFERPTQPEE